MNQAAIIIVDMQNDFVEGGALACKGGLALVPVINKLMADHPQALVVTSQDWHPLKTAHFDKWPVHCVAGSKGAALVDGLNLPDNPWHYVPVLKGTGTADDGYSAFEGRTDLEWSLDAALKVVNISTVFICGIATDYCVKATALDAMKLGYETILVTNAIVGVANPTIEESLAEMQQAGILMMELR